MRKKILAATLILGVAIMPGAKAEETGATTSPERAAYQAAKANYRTAVEAYKVQKAEVKVLRESAKTSA